MGGAESGGFLNQILFAAHPPEKVGLRMLSGPPASREVASGDRHPHAEVQSLRDRFMGKRLATALLVRAEEREMGREAGAQSSEAKRIPAKGRKGEREIGTWQRTRRSPGKVREPLVSSGAKKGEPSKKKQQREERGELHG